MLKLEVAARELQFLLQRHQGLAARRQARPKQVAQRDHHPPSRRHVGVHDRRDSVQRVEEEVGVHFRSQCSQLGPRELRGKVRCRPLSPDGEAPVVPRQRAGDERDVDEQIQREESHGVTLHLLQERNSGALQPDGGAQANREDAVQDHEGRRHHDVGGNSSKEALPHEPPRSPLDRQTQNHPRDRRQRTHEEHPEQGRGWGRRLTRPGPAHGDAEQVDREIDDRHHGDERDTEKQRSPGELIGRYFVHRTVRELCVIFR